MVGIEITQESKGSWSITLTDHAETSWEDIPPVDTKDAIEIVTRAMREADE